MRSKKINICPYVCWYALCLNMLFTPMRPMSLGAVCCRDTVVPVRHKANDQSWRQVFLISFPDISRKMLLSSQIRIFYFFTIGLSPCTAWVGDKYIGEVISPFRTVPRQKNDSTVSIFSELTTKKSQFC